MKTELLGSQAHETLSFILAAIALGRTFPT